MQKEDGLVNLRPDGKLVYRHAWEDAQARVAGVRALLGELGALAG